MSMTVPIDRKFQNAVWRRIIRPAIGDLSVAGAMQLAKLAFSAPDKRFRRQLAAKARQGKLTAVERKTLDGYEYVAQIISLIKSKARCSLHDGIAIKLTKTAGREA
jgi:hypothetical protein